MKEISPVAYFHSPLKEKFGIPRQAGLAPDVPGKVVLEPEWRTADALRELDGFDYLWLIWGFDRNEGQEPFSKGIKATVRPPRLGGNRRVGVFASRSPFRPNGLGLSSVRISSVDFDKCEIEVLGADLADGTPIYDIKPYVRYADSHPEARSGFTDDTAWQPLEVVIPDDIAASLPPEDLAAVREILSLDPRPQYQDDPTREYGLTYGPYNLRFRVSSHLLTLISL